MKSKLSRIQRRWHRLTFEIFVNCLLLLRTRPTPRARIHWIGTYGRPRRFERALFVSLLFLGLILLEPREYILWSTMCGGMTSIFVTLHSIYLLIPRKRAHWVKQL